MNRKLVSLVAFVACAAVAVWMTSARPPAPELHRHGRQFTLHQTLSWNSDPVIVLGDSIVEASTLPRSICGHAIVNAGLNGASTASDLGGWLATALDGKRAAAIIVSLGGNDAMAPSGRSTEAFAARYDTLLARLSKLTSRLAVLQIVPVEARGRMTADLRDEAMQTIAGYNPIIRDLAARHGVPFIALPPMSAPFTVDGTHLNANGYLIWDQAVLQAAATACS
jgi:lysophospholipase L1-like esterase